MRPRTASWAAVLALLATGTVAAFAAGGGHGSSGVKGRVVACGLVHERAAPCARGAQAPVVLVRRGDRIVRRVKPGRRGGFRVRLPPGRYTLAVRGATAGTGAPVPRVPVLVPAGTWVAVTLTSGAVAPPAG